MAWFNQFDPHVERLEVQRTSMAYVIRTTGNPMALVMPAWRAARVDPLVALRHE